MALTNRFLPHSVQINTYAGTTAWVDGVESVSPEAGVTLFEETAGSATDREFVAERDVQPTIPILTCDLSALAVVGFSGVLINAGSAATGLVAYARELPQEGLPTPIATANHISLAVSDGLIVPMGIRCSHNQSARLALLVHAILGSTPTYSGATPIVRTAGQTIPSGAGQTQKVYTVGPVKWTLTGGASTLLQGISDLATDFGIGVLKESDTGDVYPTHVSIISRMSRFEFTTKDVAKIAAIGDGISVSAFAQYYRQVADDGQRVAAATTTHIKISGTAGMIVPGSTALRHKTPGTQAFTYIPELNTNLIAISTTSAIPTS